MHSACGKEVKAKYYTEDSMLVIDDGRPFLEDQYAVCGWWHLQKNGCYNIEYFSDTLLLSGMRTKESDYAVFTVIKLE